MRAAARWHRRHATFGPMIERQNHQRFANRYESRPCENGWSRGVERLWVSAVPIAVVRHVPAAMGARTVRACVLSARRTVEPR
jgi:hypothetical protein